MLADIEKGPLDGLRGDKRVTHSSKDGTLNERTVSTTPYGKGFENRSLAPASFERFNSSKHVRLQLPIFKQGKVLLMSSGGHDPERNNRNQHERNTWIQVKHYAEGLIGLAIAAYLGLVAGSVIGSVLGVVVFHSMLGLGIGFACGRFARSIFWESSPLTALFIQILSGGSASIFIAWIVKATLVTSNPLFILALLSLLAGGVYGYTRPLMMN